MLFSNPLGMQIAKKEFIASRDTYIHSNVFTSGYYETDDFYISPTTFDLSSPFPMSNDCVPPSSICLLFGRKRTTALGGLFHYFPQLRKKGSTEGRKAFLSNSSPTARLFVGHLGRHHRPLPDIPDNFRLLSPLI